MWTVLDNRFFGKNAEVEDFLTKVLNLFLKDAKTFSYAFLLIPIGNIVFKGKQTKTRFRGKKFSE